MIALRLAQACAGSMVTLAGARVRVTGPLSIRLSVVAGNRRVQRLMDRALRPGATAIDVGANIGYNTVYAATRVGPSGRVIAIEPTADSVAVLAENVRRNALAHVEIHAVAAGCRRESRQLFVRGAHSAVNSLFPTSIYADVSSVEAVQVIPLDELVPGDAHLVKVDVEGGELEVLGGMTRLLQSAAIRLIVEWHPRLQEHGGHAADALPRFLLERGFRLEGASHTRVTALASGDIERVADRLRRAGRPIELFAQR
jgi:FkbM family methyltransferase